jgi:hypothetical protein
MPIRPQTITLKLVVERKLPSLPRYVVVPAAAIAGWGLTATTLLEVALDGRAAGRRTIKRWDDARWFVTITQPDCKQGGFDVGDSVRVTLTRTSTALPVELKSVIADSSAARAAWQRHTPSQQRMIHEHVAAAKQAATRTARARRALGLPGDGAKPAKSGKRGQRGKPAGNR